MSQWALSLKGERKRTEFGLLRLNHEVKILAGRSPWSQVIWDIDWSNLYSPPSSSLPFNKQDRHFQGRELNDRESLRGTQGELWAVKNSESFLGLGSLRAEGVTGHFFHPYLILITWLSPRISTTFRRLLFSCFQYYFTVPGHSSGIVPGLPGFRSNWKYLCRWNCSP